MELFNHTKHLYSQSISFWCSDISLLLGRFLKGILAWARLGCESEIPNC